MKLVLQIGGAKCGSSAIQNFLRDNAVTMKSSDILVPSAQLDMTDDIRGEEIDFFASLINREDAERIVFDRLNALRAHMQQIGLHTLVVSAENLINPDNFQNLFVNAKDLFDIQIVAYVRRQDDYFASAWQQWHLKIYPSLQAYVDDRLGKDANWAQMLAPWEEPAITCMMPTLLTRTSASSIGSRTPTVHALRRSILAMARDTPCGK